MAIIRGTLNNDHLSGTNYNDKIYGLKGNDILFAGLGHDTLIGGAGADTFVLTYSTDGTINNTDLPDYKQGEDDILFHYSNDPPPDHGNPPGNPTNRAPEFIYDSLTGAFLYDVDGTDMAEPVQIATLPTGLAINNKDISVIDSTALGSSALTDISVSDITKFDSSPSTDIFVSNITTLGY